MESLRNAPVSCISFDPLLLKINRRETKFISYRQRAVNAKRACQANLFSERGALIFRDFDDELIICPITALGKHVLLSLIWWFGYFITKRFFFLSDDPGDNPDNLLRRSRIHDLCSTSPAIATNTVQKTFFTCSFFPNASITASASCLHPEPDNFRQEHKERQEHDGCANERERNFGPAWQDTSQAGPQ